MMLKNFPEDTHLNEYHPCSRIIGILALLVDALEPLFLFMVILRLLFLFPGENINLLALKQLWSNMLKPVQGKKKNIMLSTIFTKAMVTKQSLKMK